MTTPRFCSHCGAQLAAGVRFCASCGSAVQAAPAAATSSPVAPPPPPPYRTLAPVQPAYVPQAEPIVTIVPGLNRHKGFLGFSIDNFTLVLTPGRMIFVLLDTNTMKALVEEARQQAKAQGKGAMGQWVAQMGWMNLHIQRLQALSPDAILAQFPGSFFIPNNAISKVKVKQVSTGSDDSAGRDQTEIHLDTASGKHKFVLPSTTMSVKEIKQRLQQTLGAIVR